MAYIFAEYLVGQHHADPSWPMDQRLTALLVRTYGRDANTNDLLIADGPGGNLPNEPNSLGRQIDRALWYDSGQVDPSGVSREAPFWGGAFPALAVAASGTQSDAYKSKVVSSVLALPAFDQDPSDPSSWRADTGVLPQRVSLLGGQDAPAGTPLIVLPFSVQTEQQMAAFKADSSLVAVWRGGRARGPLGTLVYDVDATGALDNLRRARDQSSWRVYRLPTSGLLGFGADPATGTASKPLPISSGLAWQLGLDVDGQAGYGMVVDQVGGSSPTAPDQRSPADPATATGTVSKPPSGGAPGTTGGAGGGPGTQSISSVFGITSRTGFGGSSVGLFQDKHRIAVTPDGDPVNPDHWNVLQPIDGDGFDAPAKTGGLWVKARSGGPIKTEVAWLYDPVDSHAFLGGTREGLRKWQASSVFDVPPHDDKQPGHDKAGGLDKTGSTDKFGGFDKSASSDKGGPSDKAVGSDKAIGDGENAKPTADGNAVKVIRDRTPVGYPVDGPVGRPGPASPPFVPNPGPGGPGPGDSGGVFTFGGGILFGGDTPPVSGRTDLADDAPILTDRSYARTPLEVAVPAILGRAIVARGFDLRGRTDELTDEQEDAYDLPTPITGAISAIGAQSSAAFEWFPEALPGSSLFRGGSALRGGFALTPSTVDARQIQNGEDIPADLPDTYFYLATLASQVAWSDYNLDAEPINGYVAGRDSDASWSINFFDDSGVSGGVDEVPPALYFDASDPASLVARIWGYDVVTTASNGYGGFFGDGADGAAAMNGGAVAGCSLAASTYTLSRDVNWTSVTMSGSYVLATAGFRVYVNGTLTVGASNRISADGGDGVGGGGAPGQGQTAHTLGASASGATGTLATPGNFTAGVAGSNQADSFGGNGAAGGGAGLFPVGGGAAGTVTAPSANYGDLRQTPQIALASLLSFQGFLGLNGGASGGSGASSNNVAAVGTVYGGPGGAGGGVLMIAARKIVNAGTISANGGRGGDGAIGSSGDQGGGGGGGGGGGLACVLYGGLGSTLGTVQANGGAGGTGAIGGSSTGANGSAGSAGKTRTLGI